MIRVYDKNIGIGWFEEVWRNESRFLVFFVGVLLGYVYLSLGLFFMVGVTE